MNQQLTKEQLIGEFEEVYENDIKISSLEEQIKVIKQDTTDRLKDFAKDNEIKELKWLKDNYKRWKDLKFNGKDPNGDEDFYTLLAMVDEAIAEESDESGGDK